MAISETMSNFSDWMQLYQNNFSVNQTPPTTTTTTTAVGAAAAANIPTATDSSRNNINLSPDQGRISKPIRRRSRASRRTPTTLLNTDITNFRAMVQQFTGGPAARTHLPNGGAASGFGVGAQQISANPAMTTPASGFFFQYPNQLQQQQVFMSSVQNMQLDRSGTGGGVSSHSPPQGSSSANDRDRDRDRDRDFNNYMLG